MKKIFTLPIALTIVASSPAQPGYLFGAFAPGVQIPNPHPLTTIDSTVWNDVKTVSSGNVEFSMTSAFWEGNQPQVYLIPPVNPRDRFAAVDCRLSYETMGVGTNWRLKLFPLDEFSSSATGTWQSANLIVEKGTPVQIGDVYFEPISIPYPATFHMLEPVDGFSEITTKFRMDTNRDAAIPLDFPRGYESQDIARAFDFSNITFQGSNEVQSRPYTFGVTIYNDAVEWEAPKFICWPRYGNCIIPKSLVTPGFLSSPRTNYLVQNFEDSPYTIEIDPYRGLNKVISGIVYNGVPVEISNLTIILGDVDNDNEVGPSDFELVIANFGKSEVQTPLSWFNFGNTEGICAMDADLDNDGEIGPGDFETIVDNFGLVGDDLP